MSSIHRTSRPTSRRTNVRTTLRGVAAAAAATAVAATLSAAPAAAETAVFKDARGDMPHGADIQRVRVVNEGRVTVRVSHDDLVRDFRSGSSLAVFLDTDHSRRGPEFVFLGGTFEGADYGLIRAKGWKAASRTAVPLSCGYDMRLDYTTDTALIRVDRDCLGNPGPVRVEVKTGGEVPSEADGEMTTNVVDWLGKPRSFTRWVARG